jgi:protein TonB
MNLHFPPHTSQADARSGAVNHALTWVAVCSALLLASCAAPVGTPRSAEATSPFAAAQPPMTGPMPELVSEAGTPRDYRRDGAKHLYDKNGSRIFKGQLPPLMHAVGVLAISIDAAGQVRNLYWMRAPSHAPDVVKEIERTVYAAAPFPAPACLASVTYTDTWLWDKSGNFQLDTLTEGQRRK